MRQRGAAARCLVRRSRRIRTSWERPWGGEWQRIPQQKDGNRQVPKSLAECGALGRTRVNLGLAITSTLGL